jgi:cytochrome c oxidase cbb3-type subunit 3
MSAQHDSTGQTPVHVYDGIEEMDNNLPNWWLGLLWFTILFGVGYWFYVQVSGKVPDQYAQYEAEQRIRDARDKANAPVTDEALVALSQDAKVVGQGHEVFSTQCAACHGAQGQGVIGPNLTDEFWIHGGKPTQIYTTVNEGVAAKGMPTWGPVLGKDRVKAVVAWLLTVRDTHAAGGKAPQGERVSITAAR